MKLEEVKANDRVVVTLKDEKLAAFYGFSKSSGTVIRIRNGKVRVELDDTGSQDSEGHNDYHDFAAEDVEILDLGKTTRVKITNFPGFPLKTTALEEKPKLPPKVFVMKYELEENNDSFIARLKHTAGDLEIEYISAEEVAELVAKAELQGRIKALKFADTYTDGAYAGIKAELAQCEAAAEKGKL